MEDNLIIIRMEYLSNHLLDTTKISNLSLDDETTLYIVKLFKWRRSTMEDNL